MIVPTSTSAYRIRSNMRNTLDAPRTLNRTGDLAFSVASPRLWDTFNHDLLNATTFLVGTWHPASSWSISLWGGHMPNKFIDMSIKYYDIQTLTWEKKSSVYHWSLMSIIRTATTVLTEVAMADSFTAWCITLHRLVDDVGRMVVSWGSALMEKNRGRSRGRRLNDSWIISWYRRSGRGEFTPLLVEFSCYRPKWI